MMIENTPSAMLAQEMVKHQQHGIFFVGYLDPDTLGYKLLNAKPSDALVFERGGTPTKSGSKTGRRFRSARMLRARTCSRLSNTSNPTTWCWFTATLKRSNECARAATALRACFRPCSARPSCWIGELWRANAIRSSNGQRFRFCARLGFVTLNLPLPWARALGKGRAGSLTTPCRASGKSRDRTSISRMAIHSPRRKSGALESKPRKTRVSSARSFRGYRCCTAISPRTGCG